MREFSTNPRATRARRLRARVRQQVEMMRAERAVCGTCGSRELCDCTVRLVEPR